MENSQYLYQNYNEDVLQNDKYLQFNTPRVAHFLRQNIHSHYPQYSWDFLITIPLQVSEFRKYLGKSHFHFKPYYTFYENKIYYPCLFNPIPFPYQNKHYSYKKYKILIDFSQSITPRYLWHPSFGFNPFYFQYFNQTFKYPAQYPYYQASYQEDTIKYRYTGKTGYDSIQHYAKSIPQHRKPFEPSYLKYLEEYIQPGYREYRTGLKSSIIRGQSDYLQYPKSLNFLIQRYYPMSGVEAQYLQQSRQSENFRGKIFSQYMQNKLLHDYSAKSHDSSNQSFAFQSRYLNYQPQYSFQPIDPPHLKETEKNVYQNYVDKILDQNEYLHSKISTHLQYLQPIRQPDHLEYLEQLQYTIQNGEPNYFKHPRGSNLGSPTQYPVQDDEIQYPLQHDQPSKIKHFTCIQYLQHLNQRGQKIQYPKKLTTEIQPNYAGYQNEYLDYTKLTRYPDEFSEYGRQIYFRKFLQHGKSIYPFESTQVRYPAQYIQSDYSQYTSNSYNSVRRRQQDYLQYGRNLVLRIQPQYPIYGLQTQIFNQPVHYVYPQPITVYIQYNPMIQALYSDQSTDTFCLQCPEYQLQYSDEHTCLDHPTEIGQYNYQSCINEKIPTPGKCLYSEVLIEPQYLLQTYNYLEHASKLQCPDHHRQPNYIQYPGNLALRFPLQYPVYEVLYPLSRDLLEYPDDMGNFPCAKYIKDEKCCGCPVTVEYLVKTVMEFLQQYTNHEQPREHTKLVYLQYSAHLPHLNELQYPAEIKNIGHSDHTHYHGQALKQGKVCFHIFNRFFLYSLDFFVSIE